MRKAKFIHDHEAFVRHLSHKVEGAGSGAPRGPPHSEASLVKLASWVGRTVSVILAEAAAWRGRAPTPRAAPALAAGAGPPRWREAARSCV